MSVAQRIDELKNFLSALKTSRERMAQIVANDSLALVKRRMQNTGVGADGVKLSTPNGSSAYSQSVVPFWYYRDKPTRRDPKKVVGELLSNKGYLASYEDWRAVNNLPIDKVTTTFTGEMWSNVRAVLQSSDEKQTIIVISAVDNDQKKKLEHLSSLYFGESNITLLSLNQEELDLVTRANQARLDRLKEQFL